MGFLCIGYNSTKYASHLIRDAKDGDLISNASCQNCGLVQLEDIPTEHDLLNFYKSKYRLQYEKQDKPRPKDVYRAGAVAISRLKKIAPIKNKNTKSLDIGFSGGEFTYLASRVGVNAYWIDSTRGYLQFGKNHYSNKVEQKQISELEDTNSYRIVSMFHVLEHLSNPQKVIRKVRQILAVGGYLVIEVQNLKSKQTPPFNHLFKTHICYITSLSLMGLLKDNFIIDYFENNDVIFVICRRFNGRMFKKQNNYKLSAVTLANSRLKHKNLRGCVMDGRLLKGFEKIPKACQEIIFSRGKRPKRILDVPLMRDNQF